MEPRAVVPAEPVTQALEAFEQELADAAGYARAEKSAATVKAYWTDFEIFGLWCQRRGLKVLPASPEAVAAYLAFEANRGAKPSAGAVPRSATCTIAAACRAQPPTSG